MKRDRPLTIDVITDELLAEHGLRRGSYTAYRSSDSSAVLVPLAEIAAPTARKLNEDSLRYHLGRIRDGADVEPVVVFREPGGSTATLLDGMHRYRLSLALGYSSIPATQLSRDDAELLYRYATPD